MVEIRCLEESGTKYSVPQRHIPEERIYHPCRRGNPQNRRRCGKRVTVVTVQIFRIKNFIVAAVRGFYLVLGSDGGE